MTELSQLPAPERAKRYRQMADDADREASRATTTSVREAYQLMAKQWRRLADETDLGT
jgi:uncharacterized protein (DUF2252 family)